MKSFRFILALSALAGSSAFAGPVCLSNTLGGYISLGAGGCDVGTATFSGFTTLPPITGATGIPAASIMVSPFQSGNVFGLDFSLNDTATAGELREALIGYMVVSTPGITSSMISLSGTSTTGAGFITDIQNFCKGGTFTPNDVTGCANSDTLLVLNSGSDQKTFPAVGMLSIVHDLTLDAGGGGTASAGVVMDRFTAPAADAAIPEPGTWGLLATALLGFVLIPRIRGTKPPQPVQETAK